MQVDLFNCGLAGQGQYAHWSKCVMATEKIDGPGTIPWGRVPLAENRSLRELFDVLTVYAIYIV